MNTETGIARQNGREDIKKMREIGAASCFSPA